MTYPHRKARRVQARARQRRERRGRKTMDIPTNIRDLAEKRQDDDGEPPHPDQP